MDWLISEIFNPILMYVDRLVYGLIYIAYKLIICLANIQIFDNNIFEDFAQRIYVLLGIFMLFRLGFSVLQYIIDPDKVKDKSVGAGKILTNCVVSLVLLVTTPFIFTQLYNFQTAILSDNILGRLVFGEAIVSDGGKSIESVAKDTQFLLFGAFFQVNPDAVVVDGEKVCENSTVLGSISMAKDEDCLKEVNRLIEENTMLSVNSFYYIPTITGEEDTRNFDNFIEILTIKTDQDMYLFDYRGLISTITGIIVAFLLIGFCVDIAVRAIYLGFLQLISPIPIISYMDPKQTFSNGIFSNWLKEVGKTFLSLFIRLGAIFLAIYFVQIISDRILAFNETDLYNNNPMCENCGEMNVWIFVMLIIGAFMFARKVPQYLETIFGFKSDGGMLKNAATAAGIGVGFGVGGIASATAAAMTAKTYGQDPFKAAFSSGIKGAASGAWSGRKWDGKSVGGLVSPGLKVSGNLARYQGAKVGTTFSQRAGGIARNLIGAPQKGEELKERVSRAKEFNDIFDQTDGMILKKLAKYGVGDTNSAFVGEENEKIYNQIRDYNRLRSILEAARTRGDYDTIHRIEEGTYGNKDGDEMNMAKLASEWNMDGNRFDDFEDNAKEVLYASLDNGTISGWETDDDIQRIISNRNSMEEIAKNNQILEEFRNVDGVKDGIVTKRGFAKLKKSNKAIETNRINTEKSSEYISSGNVNRAVQADNKFDFINKR